MHSLISLQTEWRLASVPGLGSELELLINPQPHLPVDGIELAGTMELHMEDERFGRTDGQGLEVASGSGFRVGVGREVPLGLHLDGSDG